MVQTAAGGAEGDREGPASEARAATPLPDIKVKPPGSTTPPDVFNTVPLVVEQGCQEGALLCTCTDTAEEEEEEEGVDWVVPGRLDMVKDGFIRSWTNRRHTNPFMLPKTLSVSAAARYLGNLSAAVSF